MMQYLPYLAIAVSLLGAAFFWISGAPAPSVGRPTLYLFDEDPHQVAVLKERALAAAQTSARIATTSPAGANEALAR
jgi:hypothetical protein